MKCHLGRPYVSPWNSVSNHTILQAKLLTIFIEHFLPTAFLLKKTYARMPYDLKVSIQTVYFYLKYLSTPEYSY